MTEIPTTASSTPKWHILRKYKDSSRIDHYNTSDYYYDETKNELVFVDKFGKETRLPREWCTIEAHSLITDNSNTTGLNK